MSNSRMKNLCLLAKLKPLRLGMMLLKSLAQFLITLSKSNKNKTNFHPCSLIWTWMMNSPSLSLTTLVIRISPMNLMNQPAMVQVKRLRNLPKTVSKSLAIKSQILMPKSLMKNPKNQNLATKSTASSQHNLLLVKMTLSQLVKLMKPIVKMSTNFWTKSLKTILI